MNEPASLDGLNTRLNELERRVAALEHGQEAPHGQPAFEPNPSPLLPALTMPQDAGMFPVLGRAMLGVAGAYLLRALGESHWIPELLLAPFAIAYALAWMAAAARSALPLARATYACTSVLILAPMLWELTMRFRVLPAWAAALALAAMAAVASLTVKAAERAVVLSIANLAAAALALGLAIATHDNLPFLAVLLLLAGMGECAANRGRIAAMRWLVLLAADLSVWMLIYIYRGPESSHPDYPAMSAAWLIGPGFLLFGIAAASGVFAAGVRRVRITVFETVQTVIAFLLAACSLLYFGPPGRVTLFGIVCLLLAGAVYASLFTFLRSGTQGRNRAVFATWSVALFVAGSLMAIPTEGAAMWLGLSAVVATFAGMRFNILFLAVHGNMFLLASAIVSGLAVYAGQALAATQPGTPSLAVCFALGCAVACYAAAHYRNRAFAQQVSYVFAAVSALAVAALLARGSIALASHWFVPGSHHVALIRSFIVCVVALALAFSGTRWQRRELTQIAYAAVVLEALKLIAEDLRLGHLAYIAASVCLFAFTLIALPRLVKRSRDMETSNSGTERDPKRSA